MTDCGSTSRFGWPVHPEVETKTYPASTTLQTSEDGVDISYTLFKSGNWIVIRYAGHNGYSTIDDLDEIARLFGPHLMELLL